MTQPAAVVEATHKQRELLVHGLGGVVDAAACLRHLHKLAGRYVRLAERPVPECGGELVLAATAPVAAVAHREN